MNRKFEISQTKMTPRELRRWEGDGEGLLVTMVSGIVTEHTIYHNWESDCYVYCAFPTSGQVEYLEKWVQLERPMMTWIYRASDDEAQIAAWKDATEYASEIAFLEVSNEMGVTNVSLPPSSSPCQSPLHEQCDCPHAVIDHTHSAGCRKCGCKSIRGRLLTKAELSVMTRTVSMKNSEGRLRNVEVPFDDEELRNLAAKENDKMGGPIGWSDLTKKQKKAVECLDPDRCKKYFALRMQGMGHKKSFRKVLSDLGAGVIPKSSD